MTISVHNLIHVAIALWVSLGLSNRVHAMEPCRVAVHEASQFHASRDDDFSGFYLPNTPISKNSWRVHHMTLPTYQELDHWRASGADITDLIAWIQFVHEDSATEINALGQEYPVDIRRVRPDRLIIEMDRFEFRGAHPDIGSIAIEGRIQPHHLQGDALGPQTDAPALVGDMHFAGTDYCNVSFMHWFGD